VWVYEARSDFRRKPAVLISTSRVVRAKRSISLGVGWIVLDRVIPLDDLVERGIRPLVERTARGKIIVDTQAA
jgi:hypothetical protein